MFLLGTPYSVVGGGEGEIFPWRDHALGTKMLVSCPLSGWSYPITRSWLTLGAI